MLPEPYAYLQGALRDATWSALHRTHRIAQKERAWLERLQAMLTELGCRAWIYREGKTRSVYVLETTAPFLDLDFDPTPLQSVNERMAYVRGYFDADGGLPHQDDARFYIQFTQKDRESLTRVKGLLESRGILCGRLHNPSWRVDPFYWRFYVLAQSHQCFAREVGSWHPVKWAIFRRRMMI